MTPATRALLDRDTFSPYKLANNAAVYSVQGTPGDSTYLLGSGNCVLVADRSGNSAVNGLVLPGLTGNSASFTELTAFSTGDFTISATVSTNAIGSAQAITSKSSSNACAFFINASGNLQTALSGVGNNTASSTTLSAFTNYAVAYVRSGTTGTYYVNGVAAGTTADSRNYTAGLNIIGLTDGPNVFFFNGRIFGVRVYTAALDATAIAADAAGTVQTNCLLDVDFTAQPKTLTNGATFTSGTRGGATGITITLNSSGDLGARICGARDLVQLTAAKQPAFSTGADGINVLTLNGTGHYLKSAPYSLSQPESIYSALTQVSWTDTDELFDGNSNDSMVVFQSGSTPTLKLYAGFTAGSASLAIGTRGVIRAIFNSTASFIATNRNSATAVDAGTRNGGGFTLGSRSDGTTLANIAWCESIVRSVADAESMQYRIAGYQMRKLKIAA